MSEHHIAMPPAEAVPGLPMDEGEPAFFEPWQAKAFALTVSLHEAGLFAWSEWTETFAAVLAASEAPLAEARTEAYAHAYYLSWLEALEQLVGRRGLADDAWLKEVAETWTRAAEATPHGTPIRYEAGLPGSDGHGP